MHTERETGARGVRAKRKVHNSYLSHRIIDNFSLIIKRNILKLKAVLLAPKGLNPGVRLPISDNKYMSIAY